MEILLHMNGVDASTTFTDSSTNSGTVTVNGNAQIDTDYSKFGGASGLFDGTGDYVSLSDNVTFTVGSSDATWDCWLRPQNVAGTETVFSTGTNISNYYEMKVAAGIVTFTVTVAASAVLTLTSTTALSDSSWQHVAVTKSGTTYRLFINGTLEDTDTYATAMANYTGNFVVGCRKAGGATAAQFFTGNIDEFRFLVGTAAWVSAFTPPAVAYKDP